MITAKGADRNNSPEPIMKRETAGDPTEQICGIRKFPLGLTSGL
jgi:hypothetical protein